MVAGASHIFRHQAKAACRSGHLNANVRPLPALESKRLAAWSCFVVRSVKRNAMPRAVTACGGEQHHSASPAVASWLPIAGARWLYRGKCNPASSGAFTRRPPASAHLSESWSNISLWSALRATVLRLAIRRSWSPRSAATPASCKASAHRAKTMPQPLPLSCLLEYQALGGKCMRPQYKEA